MKKYGSFRLLVIVGVTLFALGYTVTWADCGTCDKKDAKAKTEKAAGAAVTQENAAQDQPKPQTYCAACGKSLGIDYATVYVRGYNLKACGTGNCADQVKANPDKYLEQVKTKGISADLHLALCPKCGEVKDGPKCCKEGAVKCDKCGLDKGSPGCCQDLFAVTGTDDPDSKPEVILCAKCGEVQGGPKCCKEGAVKCEKCGMDKGSPGCCKLGDYVSLKAKSSVTKN